MQREAEFMEFSLSSIERKTRRVRCEVNFRRGLVLIIFTKIIYFLAASSISVLYSFSVIELAS